MRTKILGIRLSGEEEWMLKKEAKRNNLSLADYIRQLARLKVDLKAEVLNLERTAKMKEKTHCLVQCARKKGVLKKEPCSVCGNPNSEAHHSNYSRPLEVTWLCRKHHGITRRGWKLKSRQSEETRQKMSLALLKRSMEEKSEIMMNVRNNRKKAKI